jgi:hypothetical protein
MLCIRNRKPEGPEGGRCWDIFGENLFEKKKWVVTCTKEFLGGKYPLN